MNNMLFPTISIVTPSYNQAEHLEQTILSVLNQNYPCLEYVIIDGGSTDGSVDIIKKYESRLTYWISEKDNGQYDAINKGFKLTTGEILGWINSSDILLPWTFEVISQIFILNSNVKWITGLPSHFNSGKGPSNISLHSLRNKYDFLSGDYRWIQQESTFWKRNVWEKVGGLDLDVKFAGDFKLWLDFFNYTDIYYVSTILSSFRFHDMRRGLDEKYEIEVKKLVAAAKSKLNLSERIKCNYISFFRKLTGKYCWELIFKKLVFFKWYKHHVVSYDFSNKMWLVVEK